MRVVTTERGPVHPHDVGELARHARHDLVVLLGPAARGMHVDQHHALPVLQQAQGAAQVALHDVAVGAQVQHHGAAQRIVFAQLADALRRLAELAAHGGIHPHTGQRPREVVARAQHDRVTDDGDVASAAREGGHGRGRHAQHHRRGGGSGGWLGGIGLAGRRGAQRGGLRRRHGIGREARRGQRGSRRHQQRGSAHGGGTARPQTGPAEGRRQALAPALHQAPRIEFDPAVADLRRQRREAHDDQRAGHAGLGLARTVEDPHADRPVPEIDGVRARAQPAQRRAPEQARPRALMRHGGGDGHRSEQRGEQEAAQVERRRCRVPGMDHGAQARQRQQPGQRREGPHAATFVARRRAHQPATPVRQHAQRGAGQQAHGVRVRGQVGEVGRQGTGRVQPRHLGRAGGGQQHRDEGHQTQAAPAQQHDHQRRPQQVVVLLHRQRPQVAQHRIAPHRLEVRLHGPQLPHVGEVDQRRRRVARQARQRVGREHGGDREGQQHQHQHRRHQAPEATPVEPGQVDAAGAAVLVEQARGDDEAGDDEEQVHAQEAGLEAGQAQVIGHHRRHRQTPQAVQRGHPVRQTRSRRHRFLGLRRPHGDCSCLVHLALHVSAGIVSAQRCGPASHAPKA